MTIWVRPALRGAATLGLDTVVQFRRPGAERRREEHVGETPLTIAVALLSVAALARWRKLPEPVVIAAAAIVGLIAYPLLQPQWVLR